MQRMLCEDEGSRIIYIYYLDPYHEALPYSVASFLLGILKKRIHMDSLLSLIQPLHSEGYSLFLFVNRENSYLYNFTDLDYLKWVLDIFIAYL